MPQAMGMFQLSSAGEHFAASWYSMTAYSTCASAMMYIDGGLAQANCNTLPAHKLHRVMCRGSGNPTVGVPAAHGLPPDMSMKSEGALYDMSYRAPTVVYIAFAFLSSPDLCCSDLLTQPASHSITSSTLNMTGGQVRCGAAFNAFAAQPPVK